MSFNHGAVWWSELMTHDIDGAISWYGKVCGWIFETMRMADGGLYHVAIAHGRPVAGITDMKPGEVSGNKGFPPRWFTYFAVDDVDLVIEQARAGGGEVIQQPFDVPGVGRIGIVRDPTGAALGVIHPYFPGDALVEQDRRDALGLNDLDNVPI